MKRICILISFFLIFALSGCNGYREIDKGYLVTAIGFYKNNDEIGVLIEALSSSDVVEEKSQRVVLKGRGKDANSAYENLNSTLVKPLYFEQMGTAVFEKEASENISFLKEIPNINYGIYIVKTDDLKALFENDTPNGVLGYDIISLIKTTYKENKSKTTNQFYQIQDDQNLPTVNFSDGNLMLKQGKVK